MMKQDETEFEDLEAGVIVPMKKIYDSSKAKYSDPTRKRVFVSGDMCSYVPPVAKSRTVTLEAEDLNCLVEGLNTYLGYLHGAMERSQDLKKAELCRARLTYVEGLIARLTQ